MTAAQLFDEAASMSLLFVGNLFLFFLVKSHGIATTSVITGTGVPTTVSASSGWIPLSAASAALPMALLLFCLFRLFSPWYASYWESRRVLVQILWQSIIAPFGQVQFRENWLADAVTSMVKVLADLYLSMCFVLAGLWIPLSPNSPAPEYFSSISGRSYDNVCDASKQWIVPLISVIPLWIRFAQCLHRYAICTLH